MICRYSNNVTDEACEKGATYEADTLMGIMYYCYTHAKEREENLCVRGIKKLTL